MVFHNLTEAMVLVLPTCGFTVMIAVPVGFSEKWTDAVFTPSRSNLRSGGDIAYGAVRHSVQFGKKAYLHIVSCREVYPTKALKPSVSA
jgi:hypothetical protein